MGVCEGESVVLVSTGLLTDSGLIVSEETVLLDSIWASQNTEASRVISEVIVWTLSHTVFGGRVSEGGSAGRTDINAQVSCVISPLVSTFHRVFKTFSSRGLSPVAFDADSYAYPRRVLGKVHN